MKTCPLCHHSQAAGDECEVCGMAFSVPGEPGGAAVSRLEGLDTTRVEAIPAVDLNLESVPGLEPTHHAPVEVAHESVPDIQPTQLEGVGEVPNGAHDAVPGFEPTASEPLPDERTPAGLALVCRYCRTPGQPGDAFCGRCGMRLPSLGPATTASRTPAVTRRCPACGTTNLTDICSGCGGKVPNS